uniref:Zinc knuckle CX2CX4HX4C n=1 Tax=Tanacetum cinerariifolium TaxID=118510 RepID=A0A6L2MUZ1_TANCI|nr:hypothetical protein [Tanacetum cinerariifolium]
MPPRGPNDINVVVTFGVPLITVGDLSNLINDVEAGKHDELLSRMTTDDRMETMDALGIICNSIQADNTNTNVTPCKVLYVDPIVQSMGVSKSTSYVKVASAHSKDQPKVNSNVHPLVAEPVCEGVNISIPRKVVEKGRSTFAGCLIKLKSEVNLVDVVTIGIPSLTGDGCTKELICVEYEWKLPKCDLCKIFGHDHDHCPKKVVTPPIVVTSNVVTPTVEKTNDGPSVKQNVRYEPKATTSAPKKGASNVGNASSSSSLLKNIGTSNQDNVTSSNSFSPLNVEDDKDKEHVEHIYDEMTNLFNTKTSEGSSFTAVVDMGNIDEPLVVNVDPKDWFKKPERPPTPDLEWNKGPAYNILKGTCRSYVELDYNMEECYKALVDQLDWNNPEGNRYPFDLSKPLPLVMLGNTQIVSVDYFFNNDLAYLQGGSTDRTYTTSLTKIKAAKYDLPRIKIWVSKHDVYSTKRILAVINAKVKEWYGYGHLEEIEVRRSDQQLYKFMEGDFPRLHLHDIEDIVIFLVQNRLFNLKGDVIVNLATTLRMFTRRIVIQKRVKDL